MANPLEEHQEDYKPAAWIAYSLRDLGNWVHLLTERATHRTNIEKMKKDLHDANNYLFMMGEILATTANGLGYDLDKL